MQIKTATNLLIGATGGFLIGMLMDQDTKDKAILRIKNKLLYALTGEKRYLRPIEPGKPAPKYTTYSNYAYRSKEKQTDMDQVDRTISDLLDYENQKDAEEMLDYIKAWVQMYKHFSVRDLAFYFATGIDRGSFDYCKQHKAEKLLNYEYDSYGWDEDDVQSRSYVMRYVTISEEDASEMEWFKVNLPRPKKLK